MKDVQRHVSMARGASALVLSGELTEGVSDLSMAQTAPGGVPALREVNQDRSHPDSPLIEEQPHANYRRIVKSGTSQPGGRPWKNVSPSEPRGPDGQPPGPAQKAYNDQVKQGEARSQQDRPAIADQYRRRPP